jgi:hypothetical protein
MAVGGINLISGADQFGLGLGRADGGRAQFVDRRAESKDIAAYILLPRGLAIEKLPEHLGSRSEILRSVSALSSPVTSKNLSRLFDFTVTTVHHMSLRANGTPPCR